MVEQLFSSETGDANKSISSEIKSDITYPYLPDFNMRINIDLERGIVQKDNDWTGLSALLGHQNQESFYLIGNQ